MPTSLRALQARFPIDLTTGYSYDAPGAGVPFRGAVTASFGYRVVERLMPGVSLGYVAADSVDALVAGVQVDVCLWGCLDDLEIGITGRVGKNVTGTTMLPATGGVTFTVLGLRTGVLFTRDFERHRSSLELLFGVNIPSIPKIIEAFRPEENE